NFHLVIVNVGMRTGQPNWLSIRNEMNFVPTLSKFQPEFGGNNTTASVSGIARDPDLHAAGLSLQSRLFTFDGNDAGSIQISEWRWRIAYESAGAALEDFDSRSNFSR